MDYELTSARRTPAPAQREDQINILHDRQRRLTTHSQTTRGSLENIDEIVIEGFWGIIYRPKVRYFILGVFIALMIVAGTLIVYFTTRPSDEPCQPVFQRTWKSSIIQNSHSRSVAVGHINNDNYLDFVIAYSGSDTIGVFLSNDSANFENHQLLSTGSDSTPYSVVIYDFNNDTYQDIAVANYGLNGIGFFFGQGNGRFSNQALFSLGISRPVFITTADFNNDRRIDIAVVNNGSDDIGILFGDGHGSFQNQTTYSTDYDSFTNALTVGDFNGDGLPDIAVVNSGTDNIGIFLNYDNGKFTNQQIYSTSADSNPVSLATEDFNNDNYLDIVVANYDAGNIGFFFGYGNGSFAPQIIYSMQYNSHPQYVTVDDINQDKQLDVIIVNPAYDSIHILPGYGNGTFAPIATYYGVTDSHPYYVGVADVDNDNQSDIIVVNYGFNQILVLTDYFSKLTTSQKNYNVLTKGYSALLAVYDINHDGILDIISHTNKALVIFVGLGRGNFNDTPTFSIPNDFSIQYISVGDLNHDNEMDIVIADLKYNVIGVFLGYGNGSFTTVRTYFTGNNSQPQWIVLADVNNDNQTDVITANRGTGDMNIFFGSGDGTFTSMASYPIGTGTEPVSVAVGDINNDHYLDILVVIFWNYVVVFMGQNDGSFISTEMLSTAPYSYNFAIALADFNRDNNLDIVTSNPYGIGISILLGYGNGTFTTYKNYSTDSGAFTQYLSVVDYNNDNILDIITSNFGTSTISILFGYGDGTFMEPRKYPTGSGSTPFELFTADFDQDNHLEIAVVLWGFGILDIITEYYAADFINQQTYVTSTALQSYSVAVGDFNNDKKLDVVVANSGAGNLGIRFGTGNGTFSTEMMYELGINWDPEYVTTFDINQDSQLDIISVNSKDNSISIILGYGNGTFAEQIRYPTGTNTNPVSINVGNFNNDTYLDMVIANEGTNNIGIFYGFNYTTFKTQVGFTVATSRPALETIIAADFNKDGYLDLAVTLPVAGGFAVVPGFGNGSFNDGIRRAYILGSDYQIRGIATGDINNDNLTDIVLADAKNNLLLVYLGLPNGLFKDDGIQAYRTDANGISVAINLIDLNNDDRLDVVVVNNNISTIEIWLGMSDGTLSKLISYSTGTGSTPYNAAVVDFNNDGKLDIVISNYGTNSIGLFLGLGDGTFQTQGSLPTGDQSQPSCVVANDFNKDGYIDIAVANMNLNNVGVFLGYGNGSFTGITYYSTRDGSAPTRIGAGDFNNDGNLDIGVGLYGTSSIVVLFGLGDGTFLLGLAYPTDVGATPISLAFGDFNNDHRLDFAFANSGVNDLQLYLGDAKQQFAGVTVTSTNDGSAPRSVATGDLNSDGITDIVTANYGTNNIGIIFGRADRQLQTIIQNLTDINAAPYFVALAHLNNDSYLDIVVTNSEANNVAIFLGNGDGTFANESSHSTGTRSQPYVVSIGDLNNDNIMDLAIANSGTSNLYLLYGYGNGTFGNDTSYPFGYNYLPYSVAIGDFKQDNFQDIVIACYATDHVETIIKQC